MVKKKRPGRKATGRKRSEVFSARMTPELRRMLTESAERHSGGNVSLELEKLLAAQFRERQKMRKTSALRALCFVIEQVAENIGGGQFVDPAYFSRNYGSQEIFDKLRNEWRTDPFRYQAFELAVAKLLKALRPPGEPKAPFTEAMIDEAAPPGSLDFEMDQAFLRLVKERYSSVEALASSAATQVWVRLNRTTELSENERRVMQEGGYASDVLISDYYGMRDAQRDLGIVPPDEEKGK